MRRCDLRWISALEADPNPVIVLVDHRVAAHFDPRITLDDNVEEIGKLPFTHRRVQETASERSRAQEITEVRKSLTEVLRDAWK